METEHQHKHGTQSSTPSKKSKASQVGSFGPSGSATLEYMKANNLPLNRKTWLEINYMGQVPDPLGAEQEAEIPEEVRDK